MRIIDKVLKPLKTNKLVYILFIGMVGFFGCKDENLDDLVNFPPSILEVTPGDGNRVALATFSEIKVVLLDAPTSPLASGTMKLKNDQGTELSVVSKDLSGTKDSLVIDEAGLASLSLGEGSYTLEIVAVDTDGQTMNYKGTFTLVNSLYASNNNEMYIAGEFNGWGADQLELVADYTWEIKNIDLEGGEWKLKNTPDWSDKDWGDADCDRVMAETTGGGPNSACGDAGLVNIQFNDNTLAYTITPAVNFAQNVSALYLLGTFNQFQGTDARFTQVADHEWELAEIRLKEGDAFKFSESPSFQGKNFGDNEFDGVAEEYGSNIVLPNSYVDAFYKITFNDKTLAYTIELVRLPYPDNLYLVGGSTSAGWDPASSIPFVKTGDGTFEIYAYMDVAGGGFKLLEVQDWAGDWGKGADGELLQEGENNITVPVDGFYRITADFVNKTYTVTETNWAIVGDATAGGWDPDTDMVHSGTKGDYTWTITTTLTTGEMKFRANDAWDINLGDNNTDGSLEYNGDNIPVTAGTYTITLNLDPVNGYTYTIN